MANYYYDVLRVEAGETGVFGLPTILRNKQIGLENDGDRRLAYKDSVGTMWYWTPDGMAPDIYARDVIYTTQNITNIANVEDALDYLLREPIIVNNFVTNHTVNNKGQTINDITASWGVTGLVSSIELYNAALNPGLLDYTTTSYGYTGLGYGPTGIYGFTLIVSNDWESVSTTVNAYFGLNKYYGISASATPSESDIEALTGVTSVLSVDTSGSKTLSTINITGGGKYPFYAYPASWGTLTNLYVNGFLSGWNPTTVTVANDYSNSESYNVYTSPNTVVGTITLAAN